MVIHFLVSVLFAGQKNFFSGDMMMMMSFQTDSVHRRVGVSPGSNVERWPD